MDAAAIAGLQWRMPPLPVPIRPGDVPQPTRYAIQKARGSGWKTLEVGEELPATEARFRAMIAVNPRAYFRLVRLDAMSGAEFDSNEFKWTLIELHDPNRNGAPASANTPARAASPARRRRAATKGARSRSPRHRERVPIPFRLYAVVISIGLLLGALVYLRYGLPR